MSHSTWRYKFKKLDGVWHRKDIRADTPWQRLTIRRVASPAVPRKDKRDIRRGVIAPPQLNQWTWE